MNLPSTSKLATDTHSIDSLRARAATDPKATIKEVAKQFEALFMHELLKSMRQAQAAMSTGMLDNEGSKLGTEMLDTQLSTKMTGLPGGLSAAIARQLERQMGGNAAAVAAVPSAAAGAPARGDAAPKATPAQVGFLKQHQSAAQAAQAQTGIPASFMLAQAAHESGWGQRDIRNADGTSSFNLFGIKADARWKGPVAEVTTTEVVGGVARKVVAKFRAYASSAESFDDYARLMKNSARYSGVVAQMQGPDASAQGFAQGLQRAGYATDPGYADKLTRVINTTLRLQRGVA